MGKNIVEKILEEHIAGGEAKAGSEIAIKIDQTLTQDATGTMAYLEFDALGMKRVKTEVSVSYVDHNTLQSGFENADDHRFLQTSAAKYGVYFSKAGNGICHQVHVERFAASGKTLLGSDSHTPTSGGLGMLAIGAGGLDVAAAMAGRPFWLGFPKIVKINLTGKLRGWACAKDIILELLKKLTVKGGVGRIFEYGGPAVKHLSIPERATITNMGAELGATTSIFPSDNVTKEFLKVQDRISSWREMKADKDAQYDEEHEISLDQIEPMVACPHSPDAVKKVWEVEGVPVSQVCLGSCTNSSYSDLTLAANLLRGKKVHEKVSLTVSPGSRQVLEMIARSGALADLVKSGARILECACGPCIGMGQAPESNASTVRTFNRNFKGRSGTENAKIYLSGVPVAIAAALKGKITEPTRDLGKPVKINEPKKYEIDDSLIVVPPEDGSKVEIIRGPNIQPVPLGEVLPENLVAAVLLKAGDNITTDDIMPAGAKILPLRSNIPEISKYVFSQLDPRFYKRALEAWKGVIVGGANYGQGSSREHAALAPMFLGIRMVIAKSFARIHRSNLINFGIIPATFKNPVDYEKIKQGKLLRIANIGEQLEEGKGVVLVDDTKQQIEIVFDLKPRERELIKSGGLLNWIKQQEKK